MATEKQSKPEINFFGKILASATHEIKNNLAIINESAGLMEDLSSMGGTSFTPERVNQISKKIGAQVKRADQVLKRMNQFSHSVDLPVQLVDMEKTAGFVLELGARLLDIMGARVDIIPGASRATVTTNLFSLEHLIWQSIESCLNGIQGEKKMSIEVEDTDRGPCIRFSADGIQSDSCDILIDNRENQDLMKTLGITLQHNKKDYGFSLLWPTPVQ